MKIREGGFTLVEIIVVIAIMGILSTIVGVGIPAYQEFSDKNQLKIETRTILQTILKARSDAIMDGSERRIYIKQEEDKLLVKKFCFPEDPPAEIIYLSNNITINNTTFIGYNYLSLKPIGTVSQAGHITLKSPKGKYMTIVIQLGTGRIYMKEGKIDD